MLNVNSILEQREERDREKKEKIEREDDKYNVIY